MARGVLSTCVATDAFRTNMFKFQPRKVDALPKVLGWLRVNNPWLDIYDALVAVMSGHLQGMCAQLELEGRIMPEDLQDVATCGGRR